MKKRSRAERIMSTLAKTEEREEKPLWSVIQDGAERHRMSMVDAMENFMAWQRQDFLIPIIIGIQDDEKRRRR